MARPSSGASRRRTTTRESILAAALTCFARDGYRRTALDRVAGEAGISRAALYLHFANKEELFRALVAAWHARATADAVEAARSGGTLAERLTAVLGAKTGRFFDLLRSSQHAEEFLDENHRLCGELSTEASAAHTRLLARMLKAAASTGEISLSAAGVSAAQTAELLVDTAEGIKARGRTTLSPRAYRQRLGRAVRMLMAGLAAPGNGGARRRSRSATHDTRRAQRIRRTPVKPG